MTHTTTRAAIVAPGSSRAAAPGLGVFGFGAPALRARQRLIWGGVPA